MAQSRPIGIANARPSIGGKPVRTGERIGQGEGTRAIPMPRVTPLFTHCRALTKAGQPCKAPNIKGEPHCVGHKRQILAAHG